MKIIPVDNRCFTLLLWETLFIVQLPRIYIYLYIGNCTELSDSILITR